ncbi:MAG: hypothetical protein FJY76_03420 [Candidatus Aenigmarchaeota archaeon]|nr:hypothetical protein [Candidatus Aenigmarchaeota archaeon]
MPRQPAMDMKKIVRLVRAEANKKFGRDWSLVLSHEGGRPQIEARHADGKLVRTIAWRDGRIESRTMMAKG